MSRAWRDYGPEIARRQRHPSGATWLLAWLITAVLVTVGLFNLRALQHEDATESKAVLMGPTIVCQEIQQT